MNNLLNQFFVTNNVSLAKTLLLFYISAAGNFTGNLFSRQQQIELTNNRMVQHFIGFVTMLVLVVMAGNVTCPKSAVCYTLIGYVWFILTTKMDIKWNMLIVFLLVIGFLGESKLLGSDQRINKDKYIPEDKKQDIIKRHNHIKGLVVVGIMLVTVAGTSFYVQKKVGQYGGGFDPIVYFMGHIEDFDIFE